MLPNKHAVATLVYDESFVAGACALARSVRVASTGNFDLVALVTSRLDLAQCGWTERLVTERRGPPGSISNARLFAVYTKLELWRMVEYESIVYADADTVFFKPVDALFEIKAKFGAVMRHSELFNTGVMLLRPDLLVFAEMSSLANSTYTYTGGDQGFLNSYYENRPYARLPATWNGDWPLLFVRGGRQDVAVMHYTFGGLKPWNSAFAAILPRVDDWRALSGPPTSISHSQTPFITLVGLMLLARRRCVPRVLGGFALTATAPFGAASALSPDAEPSRNAATFAGWLCLLVLAPSRIYLGYAARRCAVFLVLLTVFGVSAPFFVPGPQTLRRFLLIETPIIYTALVFTTYASATLRPNLPAPSPTEEDEGRLLLLEEEGSSN